MHTQTLTPLRLLPLFRVVGDQDSDDFHYEEELSRHPYSVKTWWEYLDSKRDARSKVNQTKPNHMHMHMHMQPSHHCYDADASCRFATCCMSAP